MADREKTLVSDAKTNIDNFECDDQVMELDLDDLVASVPSFQGIWKQGCV